MIEVLTKSRGFICPSGNHIELYSIPDGWLKYTIGDLNGVKKIRDMDRDCFPHIVCLLLLAGF